VASALVVEAAEKALGFALPPLLVRLYREVGNGGFGPGLFGLPPEGPRLNDEVDMIALYHSMRDHCTWPERVLPIADLGCAMWTCLDCASREGRIVHSEDMKLGFVDDTLHEWLEQWLRRDVAPRYVPGTEQVREGVNPFTKQKAIFRGPGTLRGRVVELFEKTAQ